MVKFCGKISFLNHLQSFFAGTSWIGAPQAVVNGIVKVTGAKYDAVNGVYTVPCTTYQNSSALPDMIFTIGGQKYSIPQIEYILDLNLGNGQCVITAFSMDGGLDPP
uniref:Peptidase A1 domain-containing protein n=1 Tax=Panagrolaimus superbus TaxID=310955 RepID=A0A914ZAZ0_9BILA